MRSCIHACVNWETVLVLFRVIVELCILQLLSIRPVQVTVALDLPTLRQTWIVHRHPNAVHWMAIAVFHEALLLTCVCVCVCMFRGRGAVRCMCSIGMSNVLHLYTHLRYLTDTAQKYIQPTIRTSGFLAHPCRLALCGLQYLLYYRAAISCYTCILIYTVQ